MSWSTPPNRAQPPSAVGTRLKQSLRVLVPLILLGLAWQWLLRHADFAALARQAQALAWWVWLAAGAALVGGHCLRALRLQRQWQHLRPVGLLACMRLVLTHNAAVILLPLRSGEAGYLWLVHRHWGVGWRESAASLLHWRLQDATVLVLLAVLLLLPWSPAARVLLVLCAITALACLRRPAAAWLSRSWNAWVPPPRQGHWLRSGWLASAGNWTLKVLALGGLLVALADIDALMGLRAALGGELAGVQPLQGPAGLGTYEAGVWLAAQASATLEGTLVAAALAVHAFALAVALGAAALAQFIPAPTIEPSHPPAATPPNP
ncbi:MAG: lysylphosphatidylglycerol synthase domain-containing protein [Comamonadaceae bacterium]|nr:lysylphosphatidylglycerol synthase domain-containing protein [Comamonadaceae bacterium]